MPASNTIRRRKRKSIDPFAAPHVSAQAARLRHVSDKGPGFGRRRAGKGFRYFDQAGVAITDRETLARIRALAIPPAWTDVWISPASDGHLQATGRDARGRKQYRYHARWHQVRDETKYDRLREFGAALPRIRAQVDRDLARQGMPRERALASIVHLLESSLIRIGNEEYARDNNSFGLTTFKDRHVEVSGSQVRFRFRGKSGKAHTVTVHDRRLAKVVKRMRDLPGQDLFQYLDAEGQPVPLTSSDVNDYLRSISDNEFTAKDFRTWAGTLLASQQLTALTPHEAEATPRATMLTAVGAVAERLGNTVAVCRKCYIHPAVLEAFEDPQRYDRWEAIRTGATKPRGLSADEGALLRFLAEGHP